MALNASSHNPTGEKTGPTSGPPPAASSELKNAISQAADADPLGQHMGGRDGGDQKAGQKVKSEKELEKERKKAEKLLKFAQKQAKSGTTATTQAPAVQKPPKAKDNKKSEATPALSAYIEETPPGEKKILKPLDDEHHKAYEHKVVESAWYSWWREKGFFRPETDSQQKQTKGRLPHFSLAIPPPNVTGALHMGHALTNAMQDSLVRYYRMHGRRTLYIPGCDHAGIATQSVVENTLWRQKKQTRHMLGREAFINVTMQLKEQNHVKISKTISSLGISVDWTRERFTMDDDYRKEVTENFVTLHEQGLIYRANKLVNWCTKLNTAVSNIEVDNIELEGRKILSVPGYEKGIAFGELTTFKYEIDGSTEAISVSTTRPETMLGDTAIAVHPKDDRYKHLVGAKARHPFVNRLLDIVADNYVEMDFGTGAVKITPAHDPNDFEIGQRHGLQTINILTDDGFLKNAGKFEGMKRFDARYAVIEELKKLGLYEKTEDNPMKVPICSRSKDVIEPLIRPQWYMKMDSMAKEAIKVVEDGEIVIKPESSKRIFTSWLQGIQDWCLSRQLWWGHQIPAWRIQIVGQEDEDSENRWVVARSEADAKDIALKRFPGQNLSLTRDQDVLDTWFSSGSWPWSTLRGADLDNYFPTSILCTGKDILFFWVARMVMMSKKLTGKCPFYEVYTHGMVRDSEGRKMSKSLGNVIDPLDVVNGISLEALQEKLKSGNLDPKELEKATRYQKAAFAGGIPECGTDALRFALAAYTGDGDINFDVKVIHGYRRFMNKVYQATKYVLGKLDKEFVPAATTTLSGRESLAERWILRKFSIASKEINEAFEAREFAEATSIVYQYLYAQLFDVFIENSKSLISEGTAEEQQSAKQTLYTAIEGGLRMLHPFAPFITEELWQRLPRRPDDITESIMLAAFPEYEPAFDDPSSEEAYDLVLSTSRGIRSLVSNYGIKEGGVLHLQLADPKSQKTCEEQLASIRSLSGKGVASISVLGASDAKPAGCVPFVVSANVTVFLLVKGHVDMDQEISKAKKKIERAAEIIKRQRKVVEDEGYKVKASAEAQEVDKKRLADAEAEVREQEGVVQMFEGLKIEEV